MALTFKIKGEDLRVGFSLFKFRDPKNLEKMKQNLALASRCHQRTIRSCLRSSGLGREAIQGQSSEIMMSISSVLTLWDTTDTNVVLSKMLIPRCIFLKTQNGQNDSRLLQLVRIVRP